MWKTLSTEVRCTFLAESSSSLTNSVLAYILKIYMNLSLLLSYLQLKLLNVFLLMSINLKPITKLSIITVILLTARVHSIARGGMTTTGVWDGRYVW